MPKPVGKSLRTGPACEPFRHHLVQVREVEPAPTTWEAETDGFLRAMEAFDDSVAAGLASEGERQNGKGDYFNDLVAQLLENCSGAPLSRRPKVPGLIFPNHNLDVAYPPTGKVIEVLVEAKMMGTPKHPGNPAANAEGRPGSADMLKRCKEAGFKTIDLKAGFSYRLAASGAGHQEPMAGSLTNWLRRVKPSSFIVFGVRVVSQQDFDAVMTTASAMREVMDGVGIFPFRPVGFQPESLSPAKYEECPGTPQAMRLSVVLWEICQQLRAAVSKPIPVEVAAVPTPAEQAGERVAAAGGDPDENP